MIWNVSEYPAGEGDLPEESKEEERNVHGGFDGDNRLRRRWLLLGGRGGGGRAGHGRVPERGRRGTAGQRGGKGFGQPDARQYQLQHRHRQSDGDRVERERVEQIVEQIVRVSDAWEDTEGLGGEEDHVAGLGDAFRRRRVVADGEEARRQEGERIRQRVHEFFQV